MKACLVGQDDFFKVVHFYHAIEGEEDTVLQATERVVAVFGRGGIVGAVRVCVEDGVLVLRTLYVLPEHRGVGVATTILAKALSVIGNNACYCLPYPHLRAFYERFGFVEIGKERLPGFLQERYDTYNRSFAVIAMKKCEGQQKTW